MSIIRKIAALFVAAVVSVGALGAVSVSAGAESIFSTAKELKSGVKAKGYLNQKRTPADYKISVSKSGTLKINYTICLEMSDIIVLDSNGNVVPYFEYNMISGEDKKYHQGYITPYWNKTTEQCKLSASYEVEKGTYYIRLITEATINGTGKYELTATYPSTTATKAKITCLTLTVNKGSTVQLGALVSPSGEAVMWTSSKTSVATVSSSGKVTAKAKGSATITAKCGTSTQKIKIIVK